MSKKVLVDLDLNGHDILNGGSIHGTADKTVGTLTIQTQGTSVQFNGSQDVTVTPGELFNGVVTEIQLADGTPVNTQDGVAIIPTTSGSTGAQGIQGIQGPTGSQGIQGTTGLQGPTGARGRNGIDGNQGPTGYRGPQGPTGASGSQGPTGYRGPQGTNGSPGGNGSQGPTGYRGSQGPTGARGQAGTSLNYSSNATANYLAYRDSNRSCQFYRLYASGGFFESSDIRLKTNIVDMDHHGILEKLNKLRKVYYTLIEDEKNERQIGLIAQELKNDFPELIVELSNGYLNITYDKVVVLVLLAIDELIEKLNIQL